MQCIPFEKNAKFEAMTINSCGIKLTVGNVGLTLRWQNRIGHYALVLAI